MHEVSVSTSPSTHASSPGDGRVIAALCVASFLAALNYFATAPFYPEIARDLDTTVPLVGQVTTITILVSTVLGLAVGPIADRYGYRLMLVIGVVAVAINLIGIGFSPTYFVMLGLSICGGLADALVYGLPLAIAGIRFTGAAQKKAMGWTIGSLSSAAIVGTPILTTIGSVVGWRAALVGAGTVTMLAAWFVRSSLPDDHRQADTSLRMRDIAAAYMPVIHHRPILRLYAASALRAITWIGFVTYLGAFLADELELDTREVGLVYMVLGIGFAIGSVLSARVSVLSPRATFSVATLVGAAVMAAVLIVAVTPISVSLVVVGSLASSFAGLAIASNLANESPAGTGTTMVLNGSMINLGSSVGALFGGILISVGGYSALGVGLPLFSIAAAVLALWPAHTRDAAQPNAA